MGHSADATEVPHSSATGVVADSPERLFDDLLPRQHGGANALWAHQADVLRAYHEKHQGTPDVALELPTGAGKTLPGLLIAEWRRRALGHRVLYSCSTQHLARQTARAAAQVNIDVVTLVGSHHGWPTGEKIKYEAAHAVAITTYSTVFNVKPHIEPARTLLFDDADTALGKHPVEADPPFPHCVASAGIAVGSGPYPSATTFSGPGQCLGATRLNQRWSARRGAQRDGPPENAELAAAAAYEIKAAASLWLGDWCAASRAALARTSGRTGCSRR